MPSPPKPRDTAGSRSSPTRDANALLREQNRLLREKNGIQRQRNSLLEQQIENDREDRAAITVLVEETQTGLDAIANNVAGLKAATEAGFKAVDERFHKQDEDIGRLAKQTNANAANIADLKVTTEAGFKAVDERFDRQDERFDKQDERFDSIERKIDRIIETQHTD